MRVWVWLSRKQVWWDGKSSYTDTDSFIVHVKPEKVYSDFAGDVGSRFDTSNYKVEKLLPKDKNKKVIGAIKDDLGGKRMKEILALRPKM